MAENRNCRQCKHWDSSSDAAEQTTWGIYDSKIDINRWGWCRRETTEGTKMCAVAADDFDLGLITAPDFGCVLWEHSD